jgi:hypothetical protein
MEPTPCDISNTTLRLASPRPPLPVPRSPTKSKAFIHTRGTVYCREQRLYEQRRPSQCCPSVFQWTIDKWQQSEWKILTHFARVSVATVATFAVEFLPTMFTTAYVTLSNVRQYHQWNIPTEYSMEGPTSNLL